MENIKAQRNWSQNSITLYEQHLSPFGRKVMAALFKLKDEPKSKECKPFYPKLQPRYQNKRDLQFNDHRLTISPLLYKHTTEEDTINLNNTGSYTMDNSQLASKNSDLLKIPRDDDEFDHIKIGYSENNDSSDFQILHSSDSNKDNTQSIKNLVLWEFNQIIDIDDIFGCVGDNNIDKITQHKLDIIEELNLNDVADENKIRNDRNLNLKCNTEKKNPKTPVIRKNNLNIQCQKKKSKMNNTTYEKKSQRKKNYTTIKNWLYDVHPKNKKEDNQNDKELPNNFKNLLHKRKIKKNIKVIQAQLVDKDGIMKYSKPKDVMTNKEFEKIKTDPIDVITRPTTVKNTSITQKR